MVVFIACCIKKGEVERAKIFATQACECKDRACAEKILADFDPFIKKAKFYTLHLLQLNHYGNQYEKWYNV